MFGWSEFLGHLTSSGTLANLEALWVAGQLAPGKCGFSARSRRTTPTSASPPCSSWSTRPCRRRRGRMSLDRAGDRAAQRRCGHGGGHPGHHGHRRGGPAGPRFWRCKRALRLQGACGCGLRRLLPADSRCAGRAGAAGLRGHRPGRLHRHRSAQARPAALRLRVRALPRPGGGAASTSTIRRIPTSLQSSCTWARSAWSARAPARRPWPCGPRSSFCRSRREGEFARGLAQGRAAALGTRPAPARRRAFSAARRRELPNWILWSGS
jgi:hypothetical protein